MDLETQHEAFDCIEYYKCDSCGDIFATLILIPFYIDTILIQLCQRCTNLKTDN